MAFYDGCAVAALFESVSTPNKKDTLLGVPLSFSFCKSNGSLPSALPAAAVLHGLSPGLKKCPPDTFLRRLRRRRPLRVRYLNTIPKQKAHPIGLFILVDDNFLWGGASHRLWTRFSAEKPRRLQVSTGHLPSAAFRVRYLNTIPKQKAHPIGWTFYFGGR